MASAFILGRMRADILSCNWKNSFSALDFSATLYSGTQFAPLDKLRLDLFDRNALLVPTRLGHQQILELLPEFRVLTKIDLDRNLAAFLVGHVVNSGHGIPSKERLCLI
jgi:hypothetical protein